MKAIIRQLILAAGGLLAAAGVQAQAPGSVSTYGGPLATVAIATDGTHADAAETIYIGPGTYDINGTWEIYSKYVVIDPAAIITGTGTIRLYNPSAAGGAASPTLIDGNAGSNAIAVNIELQNATGMLLTNIDFPADLTAAGFTNNTTAASVYVGADLNLAVDGANVTLGTAVTGDLRFDGDATISNYSPNRMVITGNSIQSHMVKDAYTGSFVFPVGIAAGDYTPVEISNTIANGMHVSVQDYTASAAGESVWPTGSGMDRTWNIYADNAAGNSIIMLQHNSSTNQSAFTDASHFVTRDGTAPNTSGDNASLNSWQSNTLGAGTTGTISTTGTVAGSSMRSRAYTDFATSAAAATAYFSKSSAPLTPLPVKLVSFTGHAAQCLAVLEWTTVAERDLRYFDVEYSSDGRNYSAVGRVDAGSADGQYRFTYRQPAGTGMYRLVMADVDGSVTTSATVNVHTQCAGPALSWQVFPNPAGEDETVTVQIDAGEKKGAVRLVVTNEAGQKVADARLILDQGVNRHPLPVSRHARGVYVLSLFDADGNRVGEAQKLLLR